MGRMAIMAVLALGVTMGIVGNSLYRSRKTLTEKVASFADYTIRRNLAQTAINMALRALDRGDTNFIRTRSKSVSAMQGNATVTFRYDSSGHIPAVSTDTMVMTSVASFMDTTHYYMTLRLWRFPSPFPQLKGALGMMVPNVDFKISGKSAQIDGRNHDINGNLTSDSSNKPAITVYTPSDTAAIYANTPDTNKQLLGTYPKVKVDSSLLASDVAGYAGTYISSADYVYNGPQNITGNLTWGTENNPAIVYLNATTGDIKVAGNVSGWGILVCQGDLELAGTFTFHGLVLVFNQGSIKKDTLGLSTGTPDIIGGVMLAGPSGSSFTMKGNDLIAYSAAALQKAMYINKLQVYRIMRWYE